MWNDVDFVRHTGSSLEYISGSDRMNRLNGVEVRIFFLTAAKTYLCCVEDVPREEPSLIGGNNG